VTPHVSVVIPAHDMAPFIGHAVQSVLEQPHVVSEVIVVDDASTDDTAGALAPWAARVRYVRQEHAGQGATRNHGLRLATGDLVLFLDGDDYLLPDALPILVNRLDSDATLGLVQGGTRQVDDAGRTLVDERPWQHAPILDLETCVRFKPVQLGAMLMRRTWAERVGGFDVTLARAADVDFLLRLALAGCTMEWVRQPVLCYRQHDRNMTRNAVEQAAGLERVLDAFFARPEVPPDVARLERSVRFYTTVWSAWRMSCTGQADQIGRWLERSRAWSPFSPEETALEWVRQFAGFDAHAGRQNGVAVWLPAVRRGSQSLSSIPGDSDALLLWWADVWSHYLAEEFSDARDALAKYCGTAWTEVLALAQESVLVSPAEERIAATDRFCADAVALGLMGTSARGDAASLYLTAFGQAALAREWELARHALRRAIGVGVDRRVAVAWLRFLGRAVAHAARARRSAT
jgi:glycosyltransferase involved in cell wall biosynthesis